MSRYFIHEDNIEKVETRISKINKKCEKFGCNFNYQRVGEEFRNVSDIPSQPNARGRICHCISLYDGRQTSYYRSDVLGVIEPEKLPE